MKKLFAIFGLAILFVQCGQKGTAELQETAPDSPQQALELLLEGNGRYTSGIAVHPNVNMERVTQTAPHQAPFAAVVGCSDSRVPVELLFDRGIGDIFVIRTAGNNVGGDMVMGSVEYAIEHLGVQVLLVLGHESCGGVTSAVEGGEHHGAIGNLIHCIQSDIPEFLGKGEQIDAAIARHTQAQVEDILANPVVAERVMQGKLLVKGGYYDVDNGKVEIY